MKIVRLGLLCALLVMLLAMPITAQEDTAAWESGMLQQFWESLPPLSRDALPQDPMDTEALADRISVGSLLNMVLAAIGTALSEGGNVLAAVGAVTVLSFLMRMLAPGESIGRPLARLCGALLLCSTLLLQMEEVFVYFADVSSFSSALVPVFVGLYAAGGNSGAAIGAGGGLTVFCTVTEWLSGSVMTPLLRILLVLTFLSALGASPLTSFSKTVRGWVMLLFGLFSALFPAAVGFQTVLLSAGDSMAARAARFAVGSGIPVVGAALSGTLGTLATSVTLLRSTVGGASFLAVLAITLPAVAKLLVCRFFLSMGGSVSEAIGDGEIAGVMREIGGLYDLLLAAAAAVTVVLLLLLAILSNASCAIGGI